MLQLIWSGFEAVGEVKSQSKNGPLVQDIRHLVVFHQKTGNGLVNLVERKPGRSQKETMGEP